MTQTENDIDQVGDLAGAAVAGLDGEQGQLEGTNHAKVKFVGMGWDALEVPDLKEEVEFRVRGMVVGHGEQVMADGTIRPMATVKVESVVLLDGTTL